MDPLGDIFNTMFHNVTGHESVTGHVSSITIVVPQEGNTMSFNLCNLPPAEKALIEVDKAAAYAVKERNGHLATAELDRSAFKDHELEVFTKALAKYRAR
ncbi:DUF3283 family protein [Aeromonas hydrophila]|uniref:DUF3283 family protein n=1 Tax=Aeromonas hydrophila TaxID=644 RepID=UPI003EC4EC1F